MADLTINSKVSKSGDTMTGDLTIKNPDLDSTQSVTSDKVKYLRFHDKNNVLLSSIYGGMASGDRSMLALRNQLNGASNSLYLLVKRDGTCEVIIDNPAIVPWRNALGASNGIWPTSLGGTGQSGVDTTPTPSSLKMVTSGGIKTALDYCLSVKGILPNNSDLNNVKTIGYYGLAGSYSYTNMTDPKSYGLVVIKSSPESNDTIWQFAFSTSKISFRVFSGNWTAWKYIEFS